MSRFHIYLFPYIHEPVGKTNFRYIYFPYIYIALILFLYLEMQCFHSVLQSLFPSSSLFSSFSPFLLQPPSSLFSPSHIAFSCLSFVLSVLLNPCPVCSKLDNRVSSVFHCNPPFFSSYPVTCGGSLTIHNE